MALDKLGALQLIGQYKPTIETIDAPELGEGSQFCVRGLTVAEFDAVGRYSQDVKDGKVPGYGWRALTMAKGICDENGKRLFADADANGLSNLPAALAERLVAAIDRLSGGTKAEVEEIAKN